MFFGTKVSQFLYQRLEVKRAQQVPGPDRYEPKDRLVKTTRFEARTFGSGSRCSLKSSEATPGPGAYQNFYGIRNTSTNRVLNRGYLGKDSLTTLGQSQAIITSSLNLNQSSMDTFEQTFKPALNAIDSRTFKSGAFMLKTK